jgi:predicted dehydrogenase
MKKIRIGLIGLGAMGAGHYTNIKAIPEFDLKAIADINPETMTKYPEEKFSSGMELIEKADVDAVAIVTPHYDHVPLSIAGLKKGLHVLVEKPIAVQVNDAKAMAAAHTDKSRIFAAQFIYRTNPVYKKMKDLISKGELGKLSRINVTATNWFRTGAYYKSSSWRATWGGEGGGVLLNQCPHDLDIMQWLVGMPSRINAKISIGKYHDIEVEDEVSAIFEYPNGMTGMFYTTTGEAAGIKRFEIVGDRGTLKLENGKLSFLRTEIGTREFSDTTSNMWGNPEKWEISFPVGDNTFLDQHQTIYRNFRDAILSGKPLLAPAEEGINSLEMANAMLLSGFTNKPVDLPIDGDIYQAELEKLIKKSRYKK